MQNDDRWTSKGNYSLLNINPLTFTLFLGILIRALREYWSYKPKDSGPSNLTEAFLNTQVFEQFLTRPVVYSYTYLG